MFRNNVCIKLSMTCPPKLHILNLVLIDLQIYVNNRINVKIPFTYLIQPTNTNVSSIDIHKTHTYPYTILYNSQRKPKTNPIPKVVSDLYVDITNFEGVIPLCMR